MASRVNRYRDFVKRWAARRSRGEMVDTSRKRDNSRTPPDVTDPRAKSQRKGKVTADRWNQ
jgi:hypothetical protein